MRWSQLFIPTLREEPTEAESAGHRLLLRAGYIRQLGAGLYSYLPLAQRSLAKIAAIVREEMDGIGAQEFLVPALHPAELLQESGRWQTLGQDLFRLQDRNGRDLCLGMGAEEVMTAVARNDLRSYKQLPQIWYRIESKFRDEPRSRSGPMRAREFPMADSYSFDMDEAGLDAAYRKHFDAYGRIFRRCGLEFLAAEAGSDSHEFVVKSDAGEDWVVTCGGCGYAATLEAAVSRAMAPAEADSAGDLTPEAFPTPGVKTIEQLVAFTGRPATSFIKSLVLVADGAPVVALVRGDHQLSEAKLRRAAGAEEVRAARPEEIVGWFGAEAGSLGPVGVSGMRILADEALRARRNMICGANRDGEHLRGVTPEEDFAAEFRDLRLAAAGDACARCGGTLGLEKAIEIGHVSKLGCRYSGPMGLRVQNAAGEDSTPLMGSYGIGIERILIAGAELHNDADGLALPAAIAPFDVIVTPVHVGDAMQREAATAIYQGLRALGLGALLDDRDERPGVKFKDADLTGVPYRITVGKKFAQGVVELVERCGRRKSDIETAAAAGTVAERVRAETTPR
jgi:prolyl-tRNA synthetase